MLKLTVIFFATVMTLSSFATNDCRYIDKERYPDEHRLCNLLQEKIKEAEEKRRKNGETVETPRIRPISDNSFDACNSIDHDKYPQEYQACLRMVGNSFEDVNTGNAHECSFSTTRNEIHCPEGVFERKNRGDMSGRDLYGRGGINRIPDEDGSLGGTFNSGPYRAFGM